MDDSHRWESGFINEPTDSRNRQPGALVNSRDDEQSRVTMPVSLAYIDKFTRPDEGLVICGKKIEQFTTVALITEIFDQTATRVHFRVADGTKGSPIDVIFIKNDRPLDVKVGSYVRIFGQAKFQESKPFIHPHHVGPLIDVNEITMHILEVIREMMALEKPSDAIPVAKNNLLNQPLKQQANSNSNLGDSYGMSSLPNLHRHVLNYLRDAVKSDPEMAISEERICSDLKQFNRSDIHEALKNLCNEGHLWNGDTTDLWCVAT